MDDPLHVRDGAAVPRFDAWLAAGMSALAVSLWLLHGGDPLLLTLWGVGLSIIGVAGVIVGLGLLPRLWR